MKYDDFKAIPHNPCASVMRRLNFVESQIFVRLPKFDAGWRAKLASLCAIVKENLGNMTESWQADGVQRR